MHRFLSGALIVLAGCAWALAGCVSAYAPPRPNEPHAVAKIRVAYHASAGTGLHQKVTIDGHPVPVDMPASDGTSITATLVWPRDSTWEVESVFFHTELRQVMETYYVTQSYSCTQGYGNHTYLGTCTRSVPQQRWVTRSVEVPDMQCVTGVRQVPRVGATYLLQYDFFGNGQCSLACFEQVPTGPGQFRMAPCGGPPPVTSGGQR